MKKFFSLLLMSVFAISVGWAAESVFYTLTPATGSNNAYAGNCDVVIGDVTWNVSGNASVTPWRIGGKSLDGVDRTVYSKTPMESTISKVSLEVGAASSITVNSLTLTVASDADFNDQLDEVTATFAANSTIDFTPTSGTEWATGAYYKFTFNVTVSGTSNKFVAFTGAYFYTNEDVPEPTEYNITYPDPQTLVGGSVSGPETAVEGATVDITVTPDNGYVLSSLTYNGNDITSAKSFTMPGEDVTIAASFEEETTPEFAAPTFSFTENSLVENGDAKIIKPENATSLNYWYGTDGNIAVLDRVDQTATADVVLDLSQFSLRDYVYVNAQAVYANGESDVVHTALYVDDPNYNFPLVFTAEPTEGGTITGPSTAQGGEIVTFTVSPAEGYTLKNVTAKYTEFGNANGGNDIVVGENSFTMPAYTKIDVKNEPRVFITATFQKEGAVGEDAMFNFDDDYATLFPNATTTPYEFPTDETATVNGVSLTVKAATSGTKNRIWSGSPRLRLYSEAMVVAAPAGYNITKIEFTNHSSSFNLAPDAGSFTTSTGAARVWEGEAETLTLSCGGNTQIKTMNVIVTKIEEGALSAPVIEGTTPFLGSTEVTITNPNETGEIRYTLDGSDPDANATLYSDPFSLTETTTVKAIVVDGTKTSSVAQKSFEALASVSSIAEFATTDGSVVAFANPVTVLGQNGSYLYVQDEGAAGMIIFGTAGQEYSFGDIIPAGFSGKYQLFRGMHEMTSPTGLQESSSNVAPEAIEVAPNEITTANSGRYAVIKGATFNGSNIAVGENSVAIYNRFGIEIPTDNDGKTYNVYGVTSMYASTNNGEPHAQFLPLSFEEVQAATYTVTFNYNQEQGAVELLNDGTAFEAGDDILFTVTPNADYTIEAVTITGVKTNVAVQFEDDGKGGYEFQMPADDVNVNITFAAIPRYTITVADDIENGTISDITAETATAGTEVMFEVTPAEHYAIENVTVNCVNINQAVELTKEDNIYSFEMPADDVVINATFKQVEFQVALNYNAEQATIDGVQNEQYVAAGEEVLFEVAATEGYQLTGVTITAGNEAIVPEVAENTYSFIMPESDVNINVATELIPAKTYPINVQAMENGSVVADPIAAAIGETVTLTVAPADGYELESISVTAGYEIQGGSGGARAPHMKAWKSQGNIELTKVDDTHYTFVLPEELPDVLTPNYTDNTEFKVSATFKLAPVPTRVITGKVVDKKGNPLAEVSVVALVKNVEPAGISRLKAEGDLSTTTDENGEFSLEVPADQQYDLTFSKAGYKSQTVGEDEVPGTGLVMAKDYPTAIDAIVGDENVASVKYVSVSGMVSDQPFDGVNIVVIEKVDGTKTVTKIRK